jgi:hypothetical protein
MVQGSGCTAATVSGTLEPAPIEAADDLGPAWTSQQSGAPDCLAHPPAFTTVKCRFGAPTGDVRVVLIGNSHAAQWVAAVQTVARARGWKVTTYLASQCAVSPVLQNFPTSAEDRACLRWVQRTVDAVTGAHYDLVVMTDRISVTAFGHDYSGSLPVYQHGYETVLHQFLAAHEPVLGIRDTPAPGVLIPNCLAEHTTDYLSCHGTRAKWLPADPMVDAVSSVGSSRIHMANLTKYLCEPTVCPAAIGHVPVYFDGSHMTATFSQTLATYLKPFLTAALSP